MKIVEQNKWVPCDGIELEESANFVARSQEDILVVAGPGAGKTELNHKKYWQLALKKMQRKISKRELRKDVEMKWKVDLYL